MCERCDLMYRVLESESKWEKGITTAQQLTITFVVYSVIICDAPWRNGG
jgi:hypothetical protein